MGVWVDTEWERWGATVGTAWGPWEATGDTEEGMAWEEWGWAPHMVATAVFDPCMVIWKAGMFCVLITIVPKIINLLLSCTVQKLYIHTCFNKPVRYVLSHINLK